MVRQVPYTYNLSNLSHTSHNKIHDTHIILPSHNKIRNTHTHVHGMTDWDKWDPGCLFHTARSIHRNTPTSTSERLSPNLSNIPRQPLKSLDQPHKSLHQSLKSLTPTTASQFSLSTSPTLILHHQTDRHPHKPYHSTNKPLQTDITKQDFYALYN